MVCVETVKDDRYKKKNMGCINITETGSSTVITLKSTRRA